MYRENVNFQPRYRIEGSLTVETALLVGDGLASSDRIPPANGKPVLVNTVCTDHLGKAFLPGSTLKGVLLTWLQRQGIEPKQVKSVFDALSL